MNIRSSNLVLTDINGTHSQLAFKKGNYIQTGRGKV